MTGSYRPEAVTEIIPCDVCHREIPASAAMTFEAEDYVAHFCGLDCYSKWKQRNALQSKSPEEKKR